MAPGTDTRERLIATAAGLWHARSYADVGVSEICEAADVRKGSFYHFFPSKRDLALAVIDERWERLGLGAMAPILTGPLAPLDRLRALIERGLQMQAELRAAGDGGAPGCSFGNLAVELSTVDEVLRERLERLFGDWAALIRGALDDAVAAGEIHPIDTGRAARAMLAYIEGLAVLVKTSNDTGAIAEIAPLALRLVGADVPDPAELTASHTTERTDT